VPHSPALNLTGTLLPTEDKKREERERAENKSEVKRRERKKGGAL
jgi:hypothetical protein